MVVNFLMKLMRIDQRALYALMALAVVVPMLFTGFILPVTVTAPVKNLFDQVERLPEGSRVFVTMDYEPSQDPEMTPIATAFLKHCFRRNLQVTGMTLRPQGVTLAYETMKAASKQTFREIVKGDRGGTAVREKEVHAREYEKWVFLGTQPGG